MGGWINSSIIKYLIKEMQKSNPALNEGYLVNIAKQTRTWIFENMRLTA
jgi:hypothetical protein